MGFSCEVLGHGSRSVTPKLAIGRVHAHVPAPLRIISVVSTALLLT